MTNNGGPSLDRETITERRPVEPEGTGSMISTKLLSGVIVTVLALIVIVVIVGLLRNDLDPTGVATVLSTMFSGIVVGTLVKSRGSKDADP